MSGKSIVIKTCVGVLVIALLSAAILFLAREEKEEAVNSISVMKCDEEAINSVFITGKENYTLYKTENGWAMEGMEGIGVNNAYANTLVKSLTDISSPMAVGEGDEMSVYGFDKPSVTAKIVSSDFEETILVGKSSGEYNYLKTKSSDEVFVVLTSDLYMLFLEKADYLDKNVLDINTDTVMQIHYGNVLLKKSENGWIEKSPYERSADENAINTDILSHISNVAATDIVKKDGLELSGNTKVSIKTDSEEIEFVVASNEKGESFIYYDASEYAYKVSGESVAFVDVTGFDVLNKYVAPILISEVANIEFIDSDKTVNLKIEAPSTEAPVFYKNGEEVTEESFRRFYQILMGLTFKGEGKASGAAEKVIIFTKENGEKTDIRFINANESDYAVSINGVTKFTITKKLVADVFGYLNSIETV